MPFICIGPVCIPWTCLPPIVYFFWKFLKPVLPAAVATVIEKYAAKMSAFCTPYIEMIPGMKKKKKAAPKEGDAPVSSSFEAGKVIEISGEEHLDKLLERSAREGFAVIVDFTAPWCKPCQAIKPRFKEMATEHPTQCFVMIDADEHDDLMGRCEVMGLPTFQVYRGTEKVDSVTGKDQSKLEAMIDKNLKAGNSKTD